MTQYLLGRVDLQSSKVDGIIVTTEDPIEAHINELDNDFYGHFLIPANQAQVDLLRKLANALQTIVGGFQICPDCRTRQPIERIHCDCGCVMKE